MRHPARILLVGLAALALPGWAAAPAANDTDQVMEPPEEVIASLYRERVDWLNDGSRKYLGNGADKVLIHFDSLKKTECEPVRKGVYDCRLFIDSAIGKGAMQTRRMTLTLTHDGDGWRLK